MTRSVPFPVGNFSEIYDLMFTYDEHSGAGNTGWPQLNSKQPLHDQNREYVEFTSKAKGETDKMLKQGVGVIAGRTRFDTVAPSDSSNTVPLVVFNGLSWKRSDIVETYESPAMVVPAFAYARTRWTRCSALVSWRIKFK